MSYVIVFNHIIISTAVNAAAGGIMNEVMRNPMADPSQNHPATVAVQGANVMDIVVFGIMAGRLQRIDIATTQLDTIVIGVINVVSDNPTLFSTLDSNAGGVFDPTSDVIYLISSYQAVLRIV